VLTVAAGLSSTAFASDDEIRRAGKCTGPSSSEIKLKPDDGRIEVEFEVDQNKSGKKWSVSLKDNGDVVFKGKATTKGASGSFSVERKIPDRSGSDAVKGVAHNKATDERCTASATI
jgi:hypothetical protein